MTASRGFKVMLLAFVILQSEVRASVISIVTVLASSLTSCVTVDIIPDTSGGVLVYNTCNKSGTKTTAIPHRLFIVKDTHERTDV